MIEANELRIGNLVQTIEDISRWDGIILNRKRAFITIEGINKKGFFSDNRRYRKEFDIIEPIPLTPEILEKCGFIKKPRPKGEVLMKELRAGSGNYIYFNGIDYYIVQHGQAGIMLPCDSLHQLQNLYYALTGEELTCTL